MSKKTSLRRTALLATAALVASGLSSFGVLAAPAAAADRTVALVGDLQSELGCASDWAPDCAETELAPTGAEGIYSAEFEVPAGSYEYKVALDDGWDEAYGLDGGGDNIPLTVAGPATLRFTFDDSIKRVGVQVEGMQQGYTAADDALIAEPVRQAGSDEQFYFVMTDRFANGDSSNDTGGIEGDRLATGFDPTNKGFFQGGDIAGLHEKLDYIEGLGTTAIWLTPSFANKPVQGAGADASAGYHGYWVTDFTRIDPHLGTNAELEALIADAHERGIKVYFDIITNHTADVVDYSEKQYSYIDQATEPYKTADGTAFDPAEYAGTDDFPALDPATSFPYTPVIADAEKSARTPDWLNDPTLYHNRGNSTWSGESVTYGDFDGLDDLMTEHPTVVNGFVKVYQDWIDLGIDGFRIDTVKHVNFEFWQTWTEDVLDYAHAQGNDEFFMFGEVYDADPVKLAPYVRDTDMNSVLDFTFQSSAVSYASGNSAKGLQTLFAGDDRYTTAHSSATALPTFLGNHDMGRVGSFLRSTDAPLQRTELANELMFLTRGQPVVYYGDEQGFAGTGGDKDARQTLFATQVDEYENQNLITGEKAGSVDRYDTDAPLYEHIAALSALRDEHPALSGGAQIERHAASGAGVYAFSRVDADEKVEYLVAVNNATSAQTVDLTTLTGDASYSVLYGDATALTTDAGAATTITVPALSAVVWKADAAVTAPAEAAPVTIAAPAAGAALSGQSPVQADIADQWAQASFAWRVVGSDEWHALGTAEDTEPRVFHDIRGLKKGTLVEYRTVTTDAAGAHSAASTYASVGNQVSLAVEEQPESPIEMVTVPGSLNSEMGCAGDWDPACEKAKLTLRADGVWAGTFDLPAGDYDYKAAIDGSWAINYGANGVLDGPNVTVSHKGGPITFYFDPRTNVVQSSSEGPIVTLPGSLQDELGCAADWTPDCLATLMADGDRDGVYEFSTDALPTGAYELKAAHGLSWAENYGVDGARDGANYSFSATEGKVTSFRYTLETHVLEISSDDAPLPGTGELRAQWIDEGTIAWPATLGAPERAAYELHASADASVKVADGEVTGADSIALERVDGGLTDAQKKRFPALAGYIALRVPDADAAALLKGQLAVAQRDTAGALTAFTGVQIAGVLDDLYADEVQKQKLGIMFNGVNPTFRLWAPTAQSASLLTWDAGSDAEPTRHKAAYDKGSGVWTVKGKKALKNDEYLWEVVVYAPATGAIETNRVTDPYSVALTENSERSVAVDLTDKAFAPKAWSRTKAPVIDKPVDRSIYELHIRDFSIGDTTVPEGERGTYLAFTRDGAGAKQLRQLADAGINTVHLLPSFDIATIEENRGAQALPACDLASYGPADTAQQACISEIAAKDGFNWGYDPYHYTTPEGSYAVNPDGGERVAEFRSMVGALHGMGLQVVLDQVFNHTAASGQADRSVLDRVVPGYYHRLNAAGSVETSTCCQNVATENEVAQKLMVDSVVTWARHYKVDGFRFDLMGHHSKANMLAVRAALDALTLEDDGVDGKAVYLYGEGWNFGEVADNALFEQATQGQLGGTGIGTFNDRLRDAVHGGSPVDGSSTFRQGFGTGLGTDPNGDAINGSAEQAVADLGHDTDLVKLGLAGNLRDYTFTTSDGKVTAGEDIDYRGARAGYADQPDETINYVDAHDNETLYDLSVFKLPVGTSMADRVRMNTLSLATVTLSQSPSFWHAGTELLRSKSLDRNSYDSGDWFNRVDWTGQESTFGSGLPMAADNEEKWGLMRPLLENASLKPQAADMAAAEAAALDLLRVRGEVDLLRLGSAELIQQKVTFPNGGADAAPGVIVMQIDDTAGPDVDTELDGALVVFNASPEPVSQTVDGLAGRSFALTPAQAKGADAVVKTTTWDAESGTVTVPARSVAVLVDAQDGGSEPGQPTEPEEAAEDVALELSAHTVEQGGAVSATVTGLAPGEQIAAAVHSEPMVVRGIPAADADGTVRFDVAIPDDFAVGAHTLVVTSDTRAPLRATLTVVGQGELAVTGASAPWGLLIAALLLLALGAGLVVWRRRRGDGALAD
ncbi:pullulanase-type alpha-1,6-glucosidase [Microbacterium sp. Re1]|uniref:Pullulanase-type alpha-1,6-glucosidase n=1 Tax=Microbacterium commune TaxID=2762219 RepID=A0ABR8W541_9MICO|nr:pullulanase-type alpha-1,6-glucosidase [Microbacterium commune]MBD8012106.1 pullulanase-type alpha-1,6-glucosidase [Microbacterium commune]